MTEYEAKGGEPESTPPHADEPSKPVEENEQGRKSDGVLADGDPDPPSEKEYRIRRTAIDPEGEPSDVIGMVRPEKPDDGEEDPHDPDEEATPTPRAPPLTPREWLAPFPERASELLERRPELFHPTAVRIAGVRSILPSWIIDDILAQAQDEVIAWFQTREGFHQTAKIRPSAAAAFYSNGITMLVQRIPRLRALAEEIARVLGFPATQVECNLFCNQPGATTQGHFDSVDTLTVQITGNKVWRIAPNAHAPLPTDTWVPPRLATHELRLYAHEQLPSKMPGEKAEIHALEPGAMLYLPRGYWHETYSMAESVSLHIHLFPCTWADAVLKTLRSHLLRDEGWRATAYPLLGLERAGDWDTQTALHSLRDAVGRLTADDVQRPPKWTPTPEDRVVPRARGSMGVVASAEDYQSVRLGAEEFGFEHATMVDMPAPHVAATLLLARSRESLSASDLAARVPSLSQDAALGLVRLLCDVGYARKAPPCAEG
ncbi:JmjC domain-containing protein [Pendulispora albinea]|uniref:Cupin-like domain-containing protein n=1 Tax=Pendulispora albinea TaxID=2741071 RepID=A0ABZ2LZG2_9BACT